MIEWLAGLTILGGIAVYKHLTKNKAFKLIESLLPKIQIAINDIE